MGTDNRPPVLEFDGVTKIFERSGKKPFMAIEDVYASVADKNESGEFITIIGPSGCGKSTLLQTIAGFRSHTPTKGKAKFLGNIITGTSPERGMLFQDYGCYPHLTVIGNISFGLNLHAKTLKLSESDIRDIAFKWLHKVKLNEEDAWKYPHELSGGMRQRVALARSLALRPRCLAMDEPFSALDEPTRVEMQDLIIELWSEIQATIICVSHSVAEAVYLGDRVWVMSNSPGTIVMEFSDIPVPDPNIPASIQQAKPEFTEAVSYVTEKFSKIIKTPRKELSPVFANGEACSKCDYRICSMGPRDQRTADDTTKSISIATRISNVLIKNGHKNKSHGNEH